MSGIAGLVNRDGRPVDPPLLDRLAAAMVFRAPDAQRTWISESVGLAHALLQTDDAVTTDRQPLGFDSHVRIVADARIDDRATLLDALEHTDVGPGSNPSDAELILRA
jgi:asparagine synthase (glutamine-hydrolysing)